MRQTGFDSRRPDNSLKERINDFGQRSKAARPVLLSKIIYPFFALVIILIRPAYRQESSAMRKRDFSIR